MKTFEQLTEDQQTAALKKVTESLLSDISEGVIRFNDTLNEDDFQARIDRAFADMERLRTPWFTAERIMEDAVCRDRIESMARAAAEDSLYSEPNETVIAGIVTK
jgi:hypothetical protein